MSEEMVYKALYGVISDAYDYISADNNVGDYITGLYDMASAMLDLIEEDRKKKEERQ